MNFLSTTISKAIADNAGHIDNEQSVPQQEFEWLASAGLLHVGLPNKLFDFSSSETASLLQLLKEVGRANLSVGRIYEGHVNALLLIHFYGSSSQKQTWFTAALNDEVFGVWNTQDNEGIQLHELGDGRYQLKGAKTFCSGAGLVKHPIVTGQLISPTKKGWQMCVLPADKTAQAIQDRSFWQPLGMRASGSYKLDFTGIEITDDDLLGEPDLYYRQPTFGSGAIRFAAVQLGGAEAVFGETIAYLKGLQRTSDPFQKSRLAEMACLIETGNLYLATVGKKIDEWQMEGEIATQKILAYTNMTRTTIEEVCLRVMQLAERCVGARGLLRPLPLERLHRDLSFYLRQPAPDAALLGIGDYLVQQEEHHDYWR